MMSHCILYCRIDKNDDNNIGSDNDDDFLFSLLNCIIRIIIKLQY